jgi:HPr kinase/phosphorylase
VSRQSVHASAVAFGPAGGVLIEGPSGSGKSHLALLLVGQGADLVADDRTILFARDGALYARAPAPLAGLAEVRGLGLVRLAARRLVRIRLVVTLGGPLAARLPEPATCRRLGIDIAHLAGQAGGALARGLALALRGHPPGAARAAL